MRRLHGSIAAPLIDGAESKNMADTPSLPAFRGDSCWVCARWALRLWIVRLSGEVFRLSGEVFRLSGEVFRLSGEAVFCKLLI